MAREAKRFALSEIRSFLDLKSGSWDRGGVGENEKNREEVQGQAEEAAGAAEEWMGRGCSAREHPAGLLSKLPVVQCCLPTCWLAVPYLHRCMRCAGVF